MCRPHRLTAAWIVLVTAHGFQQRMASTRCRTRLASSANSLEAFLEDRFPSFYRLAALNEKLLNKLNEDAVTLFVPNAAAFEALGEKRRLQLRDPRNREVTEKIAAYHVVGEFVSRDQLFDSGGVVTMAGDLPIVQTTSGGLFGIFGAKEDGGITVNGAHLLSSYQVGASVIHEMDSFVSPQLLWRYCDQLRIPGT